MTYPAYINEFEVKKITGFAVGTLRNMRWRGEGPPFIRRGRSIRYKVEDIEKWMEQGRVEPRDGAR